MTGERSAPTLPFEASYSVPVELVGPVVGGLVSAIVYQTRCLREATRRAQRLQDEDRKRSQLEAERYERQERRIVNLEAENERLQRSRSRRVSKPSLPGTINDEKNNSQSA